MPTEPTPGAAADRDSDGPTPHPDPCPTARGPAAAAGGGGPGDFTVLAVTGDTGGPDWARTVGLHGATGAPELVLAGLPAALAAAVLESLGERVLRGWRPAPGSETRLGPLYVRFVPVEEVAAGRADGGSAGWLPGSALGWDDAPVMCVQWADEHGRFPGGRRVGSRRLPRRRDDEPDQAA